MGLNRLGNYLSQTMWNENVEAIERFVAQIGGRGVAIGLELSAGTDLNLNIAGGTWTDGATARECYAESLEVPPSASRYVWKGESTFLTETAADPGGPVVCLGRVFTDADSIIAVSSEGRTESARWTGLREYRIGREVAVAPGAVTVAPLTVLGGATVNAVASVAGIALREQTAVPTFGSGELGLYRRQGELWGAGAVWTDHRRPVAYGYASATRVLTGDLLLTLQDAPVQALNPGTSDCDVYLPSLTNEWGRFFRILNIGTSGSLALMDGNRELASIGPGQVCEVWPTVASGSPGWPLVASAVNLPA